jgi:hypothetical protein
MPKGQALAVVFPEHEIVVSLIRQFTWTHILKVADYFTVLPSKKILLAQLHRAIAAARTSFSDSGEKHE